MIKIISFDIGGTLLFNESSTDKDYNLSSLASLVGLPYEETRDAYKKVYQKTNGTFEFLLNLFCQELNISATDELKDFFHHKFNSETSKISEENLNLLRELKSAGYKIIFFSNSCSLIENDFSEEVLSLVDKIYYSYNLGYTKSDSEAYRIIEKEMASLPDEFLHIGDTLKSDYYKPIANGWHAIYFGTAPNDDVVSIDKLTDIESKLILVKESVQRKVK